MFILEKRLDQLKNLFLGKKIKQEVSKLINLTIESLKVRKTINLFI